MSVKSDSGTNAAIVNQRLQIQANTSDPSRQWQDVAFIFFFSIVAPEVHDNYKSAYYNGPDQSTRDSRFLALNPQGSNWLFTWRALAGNTTTIPTARTELIDLQLANDPWTAFILDNDHSYRNGNGFVDNPNIVVCQRVDGRWTHTQGTPPAAIPNPCSWVVDSCSATNVTCDVLERLDSN